MRKKCRYIINYKGVNDKFKFNNIYYYEIKGNSYDNYFIYVNKDDLNEIGRYNINYFRVLFSTLEFERRSKLNKLNKINESR